MQYLRQLGRGSVDISELLSHRPREICRNQLGEYSKKVQVAGSPTSKLVSSCRQIRRVNTSRRLGPAARAAAAGTAIVRDEGEEGGGDFLPSLLFLLFRIFLNVAICAAIFLHICFHPLETKILVSLSISNNFSISICRAQLEFLDSLREFRIRWEMTVPAVVVFL